MPTKPIWTSKTLWGNILTLIISLAAIFGIDLDLSAEHQAAIVAAMFTVANFIFRIVTKVGVHFRRSTSTKDSIE